MDQQVTLATDVPGLGMAGDRITLTLAPSDVNDPSELPTYLAGYRPFGWRADEASPNILVDKDQDKYRQFDKDDAFRRVHVKTSGNAAVPEIDPLSALSDYKVVERAIGSFVPAMIPQQISNPGYDPLMAAGRKCTNKLLQDREIDVWALLGNSANWSAAVTTAISGGLEWNAALDAGNPIFDLQTAIEKSFQIVTDVWMNQKLAHAFLRHSKVRDHMRQMLGDNAVATAIGRVNEAGTPGQAGVDFQIPGLPPIKVVASKAKTESTGGVDYILPSNVCILAHQPPGVPTSGEDIATSRTFLRRGLSGTGLETRQYQVPGRGTYGGTMLVVSMADIAVMTAPVAGGILTNCLV